MSRSFTSKLSPELVFVIFRLVFFTGPIGYFAMARARARASAVCLEWAHFIRSNPLFWTHLFISPLLPLEAVTTSIVRSGLCLLDVHVSIQRTHAVSDLAGLSTSIVELLRPVAPRIRTFAVHTDDRTVLESLRFHMEGFEVLALRSMKLVCFSRVALSRAPTSLPWFPSRLSSLDSLCLHSTFVPLPHTPSFPLLRRLALHHLASNQLDFEVLVALLRGASMLEHLELRCVHIGSPSTPDTVATVYLPYLTHLDVAFGNAHTLSLLLPCISAPRIASLTFTLVTSSDVACAFKCASAFVRVPYLKLRGTPYFPLALFRLYSCFTRLETLDLTLFPSTAFSDLVGDSRARSDGHTTRVLPHLQVLLLGCEDLRLIKEFVQLHGVNDGTCASDAPASLRVVRADYPRSSYLLTRQDLDNVGWLTRNVELFERSDDLPRIPLELVDSCMFVP
jgi:hypothetical protein